METYSDKLHRLMIMCLTCIRGSSAQKAGHRQRQRQDLNRNIRQPADPEVNQPRRRY